MDTSILDLETASSVTETTDYIPVVDTSDTSEDSSGTTKKTTVRTLLADKALPVGDFVGTVGAQTLENKTIDADKNTITNLTLSNLKSGVLDTDLSSVSDSDDTIPSAKATKALIDSLTNGWIPAEETWTYASTDSPTFTFTISGDKTSKYSVGMKIKLTQTTIKYFIITAISYSSPNTTVTVYGGTDYTLANATITNPYYSTMKAPQGFPLDPDKWSVYVSTSVSQDATTNSTSGTVYPVTNLNTTIPIGIWNVKYLLNARVYNLNASADLKTSFSTSTSSATNTEYSSQLSISAITSGQVIMSLNNYFTVKNTTKTTWYVVMWASLTGCAFGIRGDLLTCYVKATCAYL